MFLESIERLESIRPYNGLIERSLISPRSEV